MITVLIVSHGVPSKEDPQWGCFELDQARALVGNGHKVILAAIDGRFRRVRSQRGIISSELGGIHAYLIYYLPLRLLGFQFLQRKARSRMMFHLYNYICRKEGTPDVIYAHYLFSMSSLELVHKANPDIPIVGIEHWSHLSNEHLRPIDRKWGETGYRLVDHLLAVSPRLQSQIKNHFGMDSDVVPDTVSDVFLQSQIKADKPKIPFCFVAVGTLNDGKGFDVLIKAFAQLYHQKTELTIIGDGPLMKSLVALCKELGVQDRVFLKGRLPHEEIVKNLSQSNAYVLASRSETFGVSYVEAMAMGLPVIATRCGGPESFMNDSVGIMVDVDDVAGLSEAMDYMVDHIEIYSPEKIREYVRSRFSEKVIAQHLEKIFEEEIQKKKKCSNS